MKKCPFCAEMIQDEAVKCRFCGSMLDGSQQSAPQQSAVGKTAPAFSAGWVLYAVSAGLFWWACYRVHSLIIVMSAGFEHIGGRKQLDLFCKAFKAHRKFAGGANGLGPDPASINPLISMIIYLIALIVLGAAIKIRRKESPRQAHYEILGYIGVLVLISLLHCDIPVLILTTIFFLLPFAEFCFARFGAGWAVLIFFLAFWGNPVIVGLAISRGLHGMMLVVVAWLYDLLLLALFGLFVKRPEDKKPAPDGETAGKGPDAVPPTTPPEPTENDDCICAQTDGQPHCGGKYIDGDAPPHRTPQLDPGDDDKPPQDKPPQK